MRADGLAFLTKGLVATGIGAARSAGMWVMTISAGESSVGARKFDK
jgi:hypothetical protein